MDLAPIVLFVYNRKNLTEQTIESLKLNNYSSNSSLFIFSDFAKSGKDINKVNEVREYIKTIQGFKRIEIKYRENNYGLANSIIDGVTSIINEYGKVIVLEDDMITSKYFLEYMNEALEFYRDEERVISIHGYIYPLKLDIPETFFLKGADCWGWATWKRGWDLFNTDAELLLSHIKEKKLEFDFDIMGATSNVKMLKNQISGKIDSWAIRWHASAFLQNKLTLYPNTSLIKNIGTDGSGTHVKSTGIYDVKLADRKIVIDRIPIKENVEVLSLVAEYFQTINPNFIKRYFINIRKIIKI